jgi:hypothetical protein
MTGQCNAMQLFLIALLFATATASTFADIPWHEANVRLKQENSRLERQAGGRKGTYFVICTLYYTPKESGFTAARGFDARMETRRGLKGRRYPRDFLLAVKKEGIGRISRPVDGYNYIRYKRGSTYGFVNGPVGRGGEPLVARFSAASRRGQKSLGYGNEFVTTDRSVQHIFRSNRWRIIDTGFGLHRWQVDLYWGEDEPLGPGKLMARPRGTMFEYAYSEVHVQR